MAEKMTRTKAIKTFFESGGDRPVGWDELKALSKEERHWLGNESATALGVEIEEPQ